MWHNSSPNSAAIPCHARHDTAASVIQLDEAAAPTGAPIEPQQQRKEAFGGYLAAVPPDMTVCRHAAAQLLS